MSDNANSSQLSPKDLIEQALGIIMNRFDVDAGQAFEVLRRMSRETRTQMCVVAERIINRNGPVGLGEATPLAEFGQFSRIHQF